MPPSVPDKIACSTAKDLRYALDPLRPLIEQPETEENWDKISRAIQTIAALARGGAAELDVEYVKEIRNFSAMLLNSMNSERTRLANVAVDLLTVISPPLGNKFEPLISIFIPTLIKLLGRTNKVFVTRAKAGLQAIISNCPHPRILIELRVMITDKSAPLRVIVAGAVLQCLSEWDWSMPAFAAKVGEIEAVVRSVGTDSNVDARKIARQIFDLYKQMFPHRVDDFLDPLTPVIKRYLDIKPKAGSASGTRKPAPVPAPRFPEPRAPAAPAPAPAPAPPIQEVFELPSEPSRPKMTRVGASRNGPSRAPVAEPGASAAPPRPVHSRVVSGPERVVTHNLRDRVEATLSGPMRAALPSTMSGAPPVVRSVSASGPSRMRVDPPSAAAYATALPAVDSLDSSQPADAGPTRRFRPARALMDPSQMPQRVAVAPPAQKPSLEPRKMEGPSRVNVARSVSATVPAVSYPVRVVSTTVRPERDLKSSLTMPVLSASAHQAPVEPASAVAAPLSVSMPPPALPAVSAPAAPEPIVVEVPLPSPTAVPIPASVPVSRSTSVAPSDSRPPSVASTAATSKISSTVASVSTKPVAVPAPAPPAAPVKPTLVSSKSAPIATKVSALLKRGNPNAPPPFVPKRAVATAGGGVGAATASQMARQREAIAAREKRETGDAAEKARRGVQRKDVKAKEVPHKEEEKAPEPVAAKSVRSKPVSSSSQSQPTKASAKAVPAAPRKTTGSVRSKPPGGPPRVNVKELAPDMVAPVCAPLPGSPTPLAIREVPLPESPKGKGVVGKEGEDVEEMQLDDVEEEVMEHEPVAVVEPTVEEEVVAEEIPVEGAPVVEEVEMEEVDEPTSEADPVVAAPVEEPVHTPARVSPSSLLDTTPAPVESIPTILSSSGFAFHPQLAHLMALAPQPTQEEDDFLVDLSSPPAKERPTEETIERPALGERGNTHAFVSQFHQDLMMLSGL